MADKVLCPWCGAEMRTITDPLEINGETEAWNAWMVCKNFDCQAEGPFVQESTLEEAMDSAKAAALRRYTQLLKPMTLEEMHEPWQIWNMRFARRCAACLGMNMDAAISGEKVQEV